MNNLYSILETLEKRLIYIDKMMENPIFLENRIEVNNLEREKINIVKTVTLFQKVKRIEKEIEDAKLLLKDKDLAELAQLEIDDKTIEKEKIIEEIKISLIPVDEDDNKNAIVEIRGAAGGDEANIFAGDLFRMYSKYASNNNFKMEMLETHESAAGGYSLVSFIIKGKNAYSKLRYESGAHRVQRVPTTESSGRIHTSTATVLVMPEAKETEVEIQTSELQIDVYRASGAGGQHVNKTESAVRITHIPTGIVVTCQDGRSQIENKATAMMMITSKIKAQRKREEELLKGVERRSKIGTGDRSEKIRTYNYPQNRCTDHRIGLTIQQLDRIIEGSLELVIEPLIETINKEKLENVLLQKD